MLCHPTGEQDAERLWLFSSAMGDGLHATYPWFADGGADYANPPGPDRSLQGEVGTAGLSIKGHQRGQH